MGAKSGLENGSHNPPFARLARQCLEESFATTRRRLSNEDGETEAIGDGTDMKRSFWPDKNELTDEDREGMKVGWGCMGFGAASIVAGVFVDIFGTNLGALSTILYIVGGLFFTIGLISLLCGRKG